MRAYGPGSPALALCGLGHIGLLGRGLRFEQAFGGGEGERMSGVELEIPQRLVVDSGLGEQNRQFVTLLLALLGRLRPLLLLALALGLRRRLLGSPFLPFEP